MKYGKKFIFTVLVAFVLSGFTGMFMLEDAAALDASHFKGKKITFLVPFKPGGGFDTYARLLSPYIKKYLPVKNVIVKNEPAGGGLAAMNRLARSKPNGTTIMIFQTAAAVLNELAEVKGIRYKSSEFTWLGRLASTPFVMVSNPKAPLKNLDDMRAAKKEVVISGVGRDFSSMAAILMLNAFEIPNRTIFGYGGSGEMVMAVIRKDADVCAISLDTARPSIIAGELKGVILLTQEKPPVDIPLFSTEADRLSIPKKNKTMLASIAGILDIYRSLATAPGTSPELAKVMRTAFGKAINDPGFLASAKKSNRPVSYLSGEKTQRLVGDALVNLSKDDVAMKAIKQMFGH